MKKLLVLIAVCLGLTLITGSVLAKPPTDGDSNVDKSMGQTLYLPLAHMDLSYDPAGDGQILFQYIFNRMLIRNTDPNNQLTVTSLEIYDPDGQLITELIDTPIVLGPLASTSYTIPSDIPRNDGTIAGRHCALVTWQADDYVVQPNIATAFVWGVREGSGWKYTAFDSVKGKIVE